MSAIADSLEDAERTALVDEVRAHLPAYLSSAAQLGVGPVAGIEQLLHLEPRDLERVVAIHIALDARVQAFAEQLETGLAKPLKAMSRKPEVARVVRGQVDWPSTFRARARSYDDRTVFAAAPPGRDLDTPENQALRWAVEMLAAKLRRARLGLNEASWYGTVAQVRDRVQAARGTSWLQKVEQRRPTGATIQALRASRSPFYRVHVLGACEALLRFGEDPSSEDLVELLCRHYFEPTDDGPLFELVVALRLFREFLARATVLRMRLLVASRVGEAPFARFELADGDEVLLWKQAWPSQYDTSLYAEACKRHDLKSAVGSRPDFVIERCGVAPGLAVLELKASRVRDTLGDGLWQLLRNLKERGDGLPADTPGWLVAPASDRFRDAPDDGEVLWIVSADAVAAAAVARFAP